MVSSETVREVGWERAVEVTERKGGNLILNTGGNGEPVKIFEQGCDVVPLALLEDKTGGTVLDSLESLQLQFGKTRQDTVAVV